VVVMLEVLPLVGQQACAVQAIVLARAHSTTGSYCLLFRLSAGGGDVELATAGWAAGMHCAHTLVLLAHASTCRHALLLAVSALQVVMLEVLPLVGQHALAVHASFQALGHSTVGYYCSVVATFCRWW
jgi:hypothetical protein